MFAELEDLMAQALATQDFRLAMENNATGKRTKTNKEKTHRYLRTLYDLDPALPRFRALVAFWKMAPAADRPLLALLYSLGKDFLLADSATLLLNCQEGMSLSSLALGQFIADKYPHRYSEQSITAIGQRLASSWKQAGFLRGMYKNERIAVKPSYFVLAFGMFLAYLDGARGQFIIGNPAVKVLSLSESSLRELAFEAAKRDLLRFQSAGAVVSVSFDTLIEQLGIHEIKD